ncbi:small conductance calcium-activated potassium channel protein-like [Gigantopelta aegis]|uniref:small conductance calcium-activated potassium channel protein-like n=1 Tax=Gigantopelta aegis TaxID=1735272 RepID=UPI001B88DE70|nr:small conductance calcium-activated potassium channel protein-like [Gigantopelta aegis]
MSSIVEDPGIPLVGVNKRYKMYRDYTSFERQELKSKRFATVGSRLAKRKELFRKRKQVCDIALGLAIAGIVFMVIETELDFAGYITRSSLASYLLKMCITASTVALLIFLAMYHRVDIQLFTVNNSVDDWRLAMNCRRVFGMTLEFIICVIHPIPGKFYMTWTTMNSDSKNDSKTVSVPVDVMLSLPMVLRLYIVSRTILLHSRLYQDASSQSIGALNRIHFNFRFIFKSLMALYPDYLLAIIMVSMLTIASWSLHLCEMYGDAVHANFLNSMWMIAITFLTIGYGDIVPTSYCGRGISVVTGIMGAGCTALVVAVLARKLELSRSEKYVHDFVLDIDLDKRLKNEAANVVKYGWFVYKFNNTTKTNPTKGAQLLRHQRKLLQAIYNIREIKCSQRRLMDQSVTLVEVNKTQSDMSDGIDQVKLRQVALEEKVNCIEGKVSLIYDHVLSISSRLPHKID